MRVVTALLLLCLCGCATPAGSGSDAGATSPSATTSSTAAGADDDLLIVLDRGDGTEPERYTLTCAGTPDGDHPDPRAACAHLAGIDDPFAPLPADRVCTEQYGGPETARITGRWLGADVDAELSRTDGCQISQWDSLGPLLPPVEGAVPD